MAANPDVLNSWKEVAVYLGRGVRTVQRWERDLNLPVRRPRGTERSAVIALKQELDQWLLRTPGEILEKKEFSLSGSPFLRPFLLKRESSRHKIVALMSRTQELVQQSNSLCQRSGELCLQVTNSLNISMRLASRKKPDIPTLL